MRQRKEEDEPVVTCRISPGARQVPQRKAVKLSQLTLAESREFLKSMEVVRAKARLIIKVLTDADLLDMESHSPTLTREGFMTVLQSVCSHGHKLQFGDVQQAFNTGDPIKREQSLFV